MAGEPHAASLHGGVPLALEPAMCFHVVPALREYGVFTVGISESICMEADGARVLGGTPRPIVVM